MANILKYWDNGVLKSVTTGGSNGGTFDHNELTEESRAMPNQHPMSAITGLNDALAGKQSAGDYATKTELTNGLSGKQDAGDYATNTDLAEKQNKTKIVNVTMTTETEGTSDVSSQQIIEWADSGEEIECLLSLFGETAEFDYVSNIEISAIFNINIIDEYSVRCLTAVITNNNVKLEPVYYTPIATSTTSEIPPELPSSTEPNVQAVLNALSADKLSKTGHTPNKNLVTDASGNVVEEEKPIVPRGVAVDDETVSKNIAMHIDTKVAESTLEIPTELSELNQDATHRTVTDEQIQKWNSGGESLQKLTFTGAVDAEYDGSVPVEIKLPESGIYTKQVASAATMEISPNIYYVWGEMTALNITLASEVPDITNEYLFSFVSGSSPTNLSVPSDIRWETPLKIKANKTYQVSIMDKIGVIIGA